MVTAICKALKGHIFTVPTTVELAGSLGSIGALGEAKAKPNEACMFKLPSKLLSTN